MKTKQFWKLFAMDICSIYSLIFLVGAFKIYAMTMNNTMDDLFITNIGIAATVGNGSCKFMIGYLTDMFSFKKLYSVVLLT